MTRCGQCKHYAVLHEMRDGVYGFCFKDFRAGQGTAYPVYLPDGGACKQFSRRVKKNEYEYETTQSFKCELCRKKLESEILKVIGRAGT